MMLEATTYADYPWRVGRKLKRTIYAVNEDTDNRDSDHLLGMFDSWVVAAHVVEVHNADLARRRGSTR